MQVSRVVQCEKECTRGHIWQGCHKLRETVGTFNNTTRGSYGGVSHDATEHSGSRLVGALAANVAGQLQRPLIEDPDVAGTLHYLLQRRAEH